MTRTKSLPHVPNKPAVLVILGLLSLALGYYMMLRALDTGNSLQYLSTLALYVFGIRFLIRAIKTHGNK